MELDDLDEPQPTSTDELTTSTTFTEEQTVQVTTTTITREEVQPLPTVPSLISLYDDEDASIPTESNPVSFVFLFMIKSDHNYTFQYSFSTLSCK